ncbi:MAG TPA: hypothetical protein DCS01_05185 [Idiomarina abyssalis]|jgi:hypothetical protein|uniref:hypothetical protein n=1 Tax=Idiomarina TaxID=135575 RepID=UPI000C4790A2|nr:MULTISPECIES: hypothetical protein [Idiomarina]MAB21968.1 hypothetical protein [Idiomarina sp.]MBH93201.1 hypothetical protein [Idiomarina sp.]HAS14674.1 hypothetical protein [Idiomarina abyssalis]|tara:strand:+ start:1591 stop:2265 length:675 start_codon:yes stop_codon:yes gene_type:complete
MKWLIFLAMIALLIGCTSPTVFLTTEQLSEKERKSLVTALSKNGFKIKSTSGVRVPKEFPDVVIATNVANENPEFFVKLENIIQQQNLGAISYQKFYQQKHYYKGRNVGLYIRGDAEELVLPPVLRGSEETCNGQRMILEFKDKTEMSLDIEDEEITSYTGSYQSVLPDTVYANFEDMKEPVTFKFSQVEVKTYAGMKTADKLVVTKSENAVLPVGCEFMIINY